MSTYNPHHPNAASVYKAARFWRMNCLEAEGSVFKENRKLWTLELLNELNQALESIQSKASKENYMVTLKAQLSSTSPACRQLAAECFWLVFLYETMYSWTPQLKCKRVRGIWSWSREKLPADHRFLHRTVLEGVGKGGQGLNRAPLKPLALLVEIVKKFRESRSAIRLKVISDPWRFVRWIDSHSGVRGHMILNILPHLLYPKHFERTSSDSEKKLILACFGNRTENKNWDRVAIDRELFKLRGNLEKRHRTREIDFYDGDFKLENRVSGDPDVLATLPEPHLKIRPSVLGGIAAHIVHVRNLVSLDAGIAEEFGSESIKEDEGITHLVVPFLRALGWDNEQIAIKWGDADVCLFANAVRKADRCRYLIEVKRRSYDFRKNLPRAFVQAKAYAQQFGMSCSIVVTNGVLWQVYRHDPNVDGKYTACVLADLTKLKLDRLHLPMENRKGQELAAMALIHWMKAPLS